MGVSVIVVVVVLPSYIDSQTPCPEEFFLSIFGGWVLLCEKLIVAENSLPHNYSAHKNISM